MRKLASMPVVIALFLMHATIVHGQEAPDHGMHAGHGNMSLDRDGSVMNENRETLPRGCDAISADRHFTVHAGRQFAKAFPGAIFGMSQYEVKVEPCSRVTITFVNEDEVRHQWMVHGLPKYLYPAGMFHIEAAGGRSRTGTLIVPAEDRNYLIHCDLAQHMEKGMRGQLVVGRGSGNLWSIDGVSAFFLRDTYMPRLAWLPASVLGLLAFMLSLRFMTNRDK
jgi:plastocyanin